MIAFAVAVSDETTFARAAMPGLRRAAELDSPIAELTADAGSLHACYDEALAHFAEQDDLEALVLLHQDCELLDDGFCDRVRAELRDPDVAVLGAIGAVGVRSLAWWEGDLVGAVTETRGEVAGRPAPEDVDAVDGVMLVLSPWAVRELRFDHDGAAGFDGYDVDVCFQARAAGRRVRVMDTTLHHHARPDRACDERWREAAERFATRWGLSPLAAPRRTPTPGEGTGATARARPAAAGAHTVDDAAPGYYLNSRPELIERVPASARRVLDVGCGTGSLGAALKAQRGIEVWGVEVVPEIAAQAAERLDRVFEVDLDGVDPLPIDDGALDAIVFGDVLEHLSDPGGLLAGLRRCLAPGGSLVISVPNVGHWSILGPLMGGDRFTYTQHGLLDRSHVHLFTRVELEVMLADAGYEVTTVGAHVIPLPPEGRPLVDAAVLLGASPELARARLDTYQYLVTATPA